MKNDIQYMLAYSYMVLDASRLAKADIELKQKQEKDKLIQEWLQTKGGMKLNWWKFKKEMMYPSTQKAEEVLKTELLAIDITCLENKEKLDRLFTLANSVEPLHEIYLGASDFSLIVNYYGK